MMRALATQARGDLLACWRQPLALHLVMQLAGLALFTPLLGLFAEHLVSASGEYVITNYDLASFALSVRGAVFVLVLASITLGLLLAEFAGLSSIAGDAMRRRPASLYSTLASIVRLLPRLLAIAARVFLRLLLLLVPFLAAAGVLWLATLAGHDINYYLSENPPEWQRAKVAAAVLLVGYALLAAWTLARWLFAVPVLLFEDAMPARALERSAQLTHGHLRAIVAPLLLWWLLLTAAMAGLTLVAHAAAEPALAWAGIDVHRVLPLIAVLLTAGAVGSFLYGALSLAGHQLLITRLYAGQLGLPVVPDVRPDASDERSRSRVQPLLLGLLAAAALAVGVGTVLFVHLDVKGDVAVTAHRGASLQAPENSMAAFRAAYEAGADYVELDVQRTLDGAVVVLHDGDLMRMGGDPRKVKDLTLAELSSIDIGRRYAEQFAGEHVPTLQEVIGLARGRGRINIELKYNVPDPDLAPAVIELLRSEHFLDQVVITSLDYRALLQVKSLEPSLRTGHIVTASIGNVARTRADFVSLSSAQASASLIRRAHAAGKEVHVWTVDKPEVMLRMIERGADNIITNDPARLRLVTRERNALTRPEMLGLGLRVLFAKAPAEVETAKAVPQL